MPKEKAIQSLLYIGVEVTDQVVVWDAPEEPEMGTQEFFDQNDCWDAVWRLGRMISFLLHNLYKKYQLIHHANEKKN